MECRINDMQVHYEEVGSGKPILMLHGWPLDHRHIMSAMEPLFEHRPGWRRIYPDAPGMGQTRAAEWVTTHDHVLETMLALLDALAPGERFTVAGISYGGYLARGIVHQRGAQMDGVMLDVPLIETDERKKRLPPRTVLREDPEFLAALTPEDDGALEVQVIQSLAILREYREIITPAVKMADQAVLNRIKPNHFTTFDVDTLATPFPAPALFLTGRFDHWCGYDNAYRILDDYPRATFAVLDGAGHNLSIEQKPLFEALTGEWLDRVEVWQAEKKIL